MSAVLEPNYQPLQPFPLETEEQEETQDSGVIIHIVPENNRSRWNHIDDLDSFFARIYQYHQKHGFVCMMLQECFELYQFIFVVCFAVFLFHCVDYSVLFQENKNTDNNNKPKISLADAILPYDEWIKDFGTRTYVCLTVALAVWTRRALTVVYHVFQFWDIREFYNSALKIKDSDLDNLTWHEIQQKVREVQREQQMCIHKADLSELDIYHRILRFKNYTIAMVNKSLLPVKFCVPFLGDIVFFTRGLKYNIELLFFWGPWAPFKNSWHLKDDFKRVGKRKELAEQLSKHILWVGIGNLIVSPLVLFWQTLYAFFSYAELIKREPGSLGVRSWSLYGKLYLRHFNELDHELNARLNRAYRPASKYMSIFTSPLLAVIAGNLYFICAAILAVLIVLSVTDMDVLKVEHAFTILSGLGAVAAMCRVFIPDENLVWCPGKLLMAVLADIHYMPDRWKGQAHTNTVREEFSQLFHFKAVTVLQELLSPLVTPFILLFYLRPKALDIVDFFRNFTVEVVGVGDVCSFAQMDIRRHGNPMWQAADNVFLSSVTQESDVEMQAEGGKTELSLLHFMYTNPEWKPPTAAKDFVNAFHNKARKDMNVITSASDCPQNPLYSSMCSLSSLGGGYSSLVANILQSNARAQGGEPIDSSLGLKHQFQPSFATTTSGQSIEGHSVQPSNTKRGGVSRAEGPIHPTEKGLLYALQRLPANSLGASVFGQGNFAQANKPVETVAPDMSISALYLHELHNYQVQRQGYQDSSLNRNIWHRSHQSTSQTGVDETGYSSRYAEKTPLLDKETNFPKK
ncbi:Autophagy-related protein 9A [Blattella germanica]|nr:Autophagy-related protein 9A [Blattella germanica]